MRKYAGLLVAFILICCASCTNYSKLNIMSVGLSDFKLLTTTQGIVTFKAYVDNPLDKEIILTHFEGKVLKDQVHFANIILEKEVSIPPHTREEVYVKGVIDLIDPLALLSSGLDISKWDKDTFRLDGKAMLKSEPGGKRTFKFRNITLTQVIERL